MLYKSTILALGNLFEKHFRKVFLKVLTVTLLLLAALWFVLHEALLWFFNAWFDQLFLDLPTWLGWLNIVVVVISGASLVFALAMLLAPITAVIAGLYMDDIAQTIERDYYPGEPVGKELPTKTAGILAFKFFGVIVVANVFALMLLFVPGVNLIAFFVVNGYLLGREFFEFAAMRYRSPEEARAYRSRHKGIVFIGGLVISGFLAIPIVNLLTPLFATSLMVHLHKLISRKD